MISRFTSADSILPGMASAKGGALEVPEFHELGFISELHTENAFTVQKGFWF